MNKQSENGLLQANGETWWEDVSAENFWNFADGVQDRTLEEARGWKAVR